MRLRKLTAATGLLLLCLTGLAVPPIALAEETDDDKTLYAFGLALAGRFASLGLSAEEVEKVKEGFADGLLGAEPKLDLKAWGPKIDPLLERKRVAAMDVEKSAGQKWVDEMAAKEGSVKTDSGLVYRLVEKGDGPRPEQDSKVKITYTGKFRSGKVFDTSGDTPVSFDLNIVVPCFKEGVALMQVGESAELICPSDIAYGDRGFPPTIPPGSALMFEVKLVEIEG